MVTPAFIQEAINRAKDNTDTIYDWWGSASGGGIMALASYARSFVNWVNLQRAVVFPFFGKLKPTNLDILETSLHEFPTLLKNGATEPSRGKAVRIYVTFEKQSAKRACMQALCKGKFFTDFAPDWIKIHPKYKFRRTENTIQGRVRERKGTKIFTVANPPPPEQIIWTNLEYGYKARIQEQVISISATVFMIFLSFAVALTFSIAYDEYADPEDDGEGGMDDDDESIKGDLGQKATRKIGQTTETNLKCQGVKAGLTQLVTETKRMKNFVGNQNTPLYHETPVSGRSSSSSSGTRTESRLAI